MLKIENVEVVGWEHAIRGMRNPMNSWEKSDSYTGYDCKTCGEIDKKGYCEPKKHDCSKYFGLEIGPNDLKLMKKLVKAGTDHRKFMRMIAVYLDITAPLYWWKEFDTYKVGTVANSCSTMHKIHAKEFTLEDFSCERLFNDDYDGNNDRRFLDIFNQTIDDLNEARASYLETKDKKYWWQMIQLLPSSYNQKRTVMLNYEVLANMYKSRRNHKLDEWHILCDWMETLPMNELITGITGEYVIPSTEQLDDLFDELAEIDPWLKADNVTWERAFNSPAMIHIVKHDSVVDGGKKLLYAFDFNKVKIKDAVEFVKKAFAENLKSRIELGTLYLEGSINE